MWRTKVLRGFESHPEHLNEQPKITWAEQSSTHQYMISFDPASMSTRQQQFYYDTNDGLSGHATFMTICFSPDELVKIDWRKEGF